MEQKQSDRRSRPPFNNVTEGDRCSSFGVKSKGQFSATLFSDNNIPTSAPSERFFHTITFIILGDGIIKNF
jgi:hypothetical protein